MFWALIFPKWFSTFLFFSTTFDGSSMSYKRMDFAWFTSYTGLTLRSWDSFSYVKFFKLILVVVIFFVHSILQCTLIDFIIDLLHILMPIILAFLNLLLSIFNLIYNHISLYKWFFYITLHFLISGQNYIHYFLIGYIIHFFHLFVS